MLIRKINVVFMKHSKWLFGIFTVIIIIAFMEFMVPGRFDFLGFGDPMKRDVGSAFGEKVTIGDVQSEMYDSVLVARFLNNMSVAEPSAQEAFFSLCARRAAERRGLAVTRSEITDFVATVPAFLVNGKFSYERYSERLAALRESMGVDEDRLFEALQNVILRQKLMQEMSLAATVTPDEVENFYRMLHETYEMKVAAFPRADHVAEVKTDGSELKDFFDRNRQNYTVPAQLTVQVAIMSFNQPEILKEAADIPDQDIRGFYDRNPTVFMDKTGRIKPFEEVVADARARAIAERVRESVSMAAQDFARQAAEQVGNSRNKAALFADLAGKSGLTLTEPVKLAVDAGAVGEIEEPELVQALAGVYSYVPVTNAVIGKTAAYIGLVLEREDARPAEFNEVARQVQEDFIRSRSMELAKEAARTFHLELEGMTMTERKENKGFSRTIHFSLADMALELDDRLLAMNSLMLKPGEITQVIPTLDGAVVGLLVGRTQPDMAGFEASRLQWEMNLRNFKWQSQFEAFQKYIDSNCSFFAGEAE